MRTPKTSPSGPRRAPSIRPLQLLAGSVGFASLGLLLPASGQEGEPTEPQVVPTAEGSGHLLPTPSQDRIVGTFPDGPVHESPFVTERPDDVPLPIPAEYEATDAGDLLLRPASGDPFFLGFSSGSYYPPKDERVDPRLIDQFPAPGVDGRPAPVSYGFVMFKKRITEARIAELESLGARVLGFHPHYTVRVALPFGAIDSIAAHEAVQWVGAAQPWQKRHPYLDQVIADTQAGNMIDVYINVFESDECEATTSKTVGTMMQGDPSGAIPVTDRDDLLPREYMSNGWQQQELQDLGVEILAWEPTVNAFRARVMPAALDSIADCDFVQFVDPRLPERLDHDESMPMMSADFKRASYDGGTNSAAVGGQIDSGLDYAHSGIASFYWWGWNMSTSSNPSNTDLCGHGSHVGGTMHGDGAGQGARAGAANDLGWGPDGRFYNIKAFNDFCSSFGSSPTSTRLTAMHTNVTDSSGNTTFRPHVINNSYNTAPISGGWSGTETDARIFDGDIFVYRQLHVFSCSNSGPTGQSIGLQASAKNTFCVGNVVDYYNPTNGFPGSIYSGSSRGPTGDLRWAPNVCAPGTSINSVDAGTGTGYTNMTGTSMAAPHVAGVAAQMVDQHAFLRYRPYVTGACLMAGALTKDNASLATPSTSSGNHLNIYGTGRVDAHRSANGDSETALFFWDIAQGTSSYSFVDVPISSGATRMEVCMYYHELAASAGASKALVNDLDMYIDRPPITTGGTTGEYFAQQSTRDNTEIRIISNPAPGTWRIKINPDSATSTSWVGIACLVTYADVTPTGTITSTISDPYVKPNENFSVTSKVYNPDFTASAVHLASSKPTGSTLVAATGKLLDGSTIDYTDNPNAGLNVTLGNIIHGQTREVTWTARYSTEGIRVWRTLVESDNFSTVPATGAVTVTVDGTAPGLATNLQSTSHTVGSWSNDMSIDLNWTAASDALSGLDGYSYLVSVGSPSSPGTTQVLGNVTTNSFGVSSASASARYVNLRAVDKSGNWGSFASFGPVYLDNVDPTHPTGVNSPTHTINQTSCNGAVQMQWIAGLDAHSGVANYRVLWNNSSAPANPTQGLVVAGTSHVGNLASSASPYYFHIWSEDNAGNFSTETIVGPYFVNTNPSSTYCISKVNSQNCKAGIGATGSPSFSNSTFHVTCDQVINKKPGIMFWGIDSASIPFQGGTLCVKPPTKRTALLNSGGSPTGTDCSGTFDYAFTSTYMFNNGLNSGDDIYCQYWYRDPADSFTTGLSNGLQFTICD